MVSQRVKKVANSLTSLVWCRYIIAPLVISLLVKFNGFERRRPFLFFTAYNDIHMPQIDHFVNF